MNWLVPLVSVVVYLGVAVFVLHVIIKKSKWR